jgi:putative sterol carrier protein
MPSAAPAFLESLARRDNEPLLRDVNASIRFDLRRQQMVDHWTVSIDDGAISLAHRKLGADCVATMDEETFNSIASGRSNAIAAALRGDIELSGDAAILLAFQRMFPGPPVDERRRSETVGGPR